MVFIMFLSPLRGLVLFLMAIVRIVVALSIALVVRMMNVNNHDFTSRQSQAPWKFHVQLFLGVSISDYHQSMSSKLLCS